MKKLHRLFDKLTSGLIWLSGTVLIIVIIIVIASILKRAIFGSPITGTVEIVQFGVMFSIAIVIARTTFLNLHTQVTMLTDSFPKPVQVVIDIIMKIISLGVFGILFYMLVQEVLKAAEKTRVTEVFALPYTVIYGALVISIGITCLVLLYQLIAAIVNLLKKDHPTGADDRLIGEGNN